MSNTFATSGNIGKDAEVRYDANSNPIVNFSIAESTGKDKEPIWWNCTFFGSRAAKVSPYLTKGKGVTVFGSISKREWTKNGEKKSAFDVRVNDLNFHSGNRDDKASDTALPATAADENQRKSAVLTSSAGSGFDDMSDDIPF